VKKHLHANQKVTVLSPISKSILKNELFKSFSLKTAIYSAVLLSPLLFAHRAQATCLSPDPFIVQSNQTNTITNGVANDTCILSTFQVDSGYSLAVSNGDGLDNYATITNLTNTGTISATGYISFGIYNDGTITNLTNTGTISATNGGGILNLGTITNLTNTGIYNGDFFGTIGTITNLTNTGTISATGTGDGGIGIYGIYNDGTITNLTNTGTI